MSVMDEQQMDDGMLTYERFRKFFEYLGSDEHLRSDNDRAKRRARNEVLLGQLLSHGLVTEREYLGLLSHIEQNGLLMVSKTQSDWLEGLMPKLKELIEDEELKAFLWPVEGRL